MWDASMDWNRFLTVKCEAFCQTTPSNLALSLYLDVHIALFLATRSPPPFLSFSLYNCGCVRVCFSISLHVA